MLNIKQGSMKYHFWVFRMDSTWDWTPVSRTIGEHSTHLTYSPANASKTVCIYQTLLLHICVYYIHICTLSIYLGTPLKLVDKFTYLGSSVESTEKDIETRLTKAWTAINRLSIIWKSDLTDKMKRSFFQAAVTIDTAIWMHYMDANKTAREETRWQLHKNAACNPEQVLAATPHKTPTVRPPAPYHENYSS